MLEQKEILNRNPNCYRERSVNEKTIGIRKRIVSPAVQVQVSIYEMNTFKKLNFGPNLVGVEENPKFVTIKTCKCAIDGETCPSHPSSNSGSIIDTERTTLTSLSTHTVVRKNSVNDLRSCESYKNLMDLKMTESQFNMNSLSSHDSGTIVPPEDLHLSLSSLTASTNTNAVMTNKQRVEFNKWLAEKNEQKKKSKEEMMRIQEMMIQEKNKKIQVERENFMNWLAQKKVEEQKKKELTENKKKEKEFEEAKKIQKQKENKLKYKLWCKKKEEEMLGKKLKEEAEKVKQAEEKRKREELNKNVYQDWLESSKYKPKPIPLNRGLESLRSSVSVSFINPEPWVPNVENIK